MYAADPLLSFDEAMRCLRRSAAPPDGACDKGDWAAPSGDPYAPEGKQRSPCFGYGIPDAAALVTMARDGTCAASYGGCDTDIQCGAGFYCDEPTRECIKLPPEKKRDDTGCSIVLID